MPKRSLRWQGRNADLPDPDKRGYGADIYYQGTKVLTYLGSGYGWACERGLRLNGKRKGNFTESILMSTAPRRMARGGTGSTARLSGG